MIQNLDQACAFVGRYKRQNILTSGFGPFVQLDELGQHIMYNFQIIFGMIFTTILKRIRTHKTRQQKFIVL